MRRIWPTFLLLVITLALTGGAAGTRDAAVALGVGSAKIDGVSGPGEWANAACRDIQLNTAGGHTPATVCAMADVKFMYGLLRIKGPAGDLFSVTLALDQNANGSVIADAGDDFLRYDKSFGFRDEAVVTGPDGGCKPSATCEVPDVQLGGTRDIVGAVQRGRADTIIEISHPLNSGDQWDVALRPGMEIHVFANVVFITNHQNYATHIPNDANSMILRVPVIGTGH